MQAKKKPFRQKPISLLAIFVALTIAFSCFSFFGLGYGSSLISDTALADDLDVKEELSITNGEFSETSGDDPATPNSWTAETYFGVEDTAISGVVDITAADFNTETNLKALGLWRDDYPEFRYGTNFPGTPFAEGRSDYDGADPSALLINSNGARIAAGYSSSSVSLSANSYYKISAWVKTGEFDSDAGATIVVDGMDNPLIFRNIDTTAYYGGNDANVDKTRNYGWVEYTFYIETSTMSDTSVTISLQLGEGYVTDTDEEEETTDETNGENEYRRIEPAKGYALFDHVTAYSISYNEFAEAVVSSGIDVDADEPQAFDDPDSERSYYVNAEGTSMYYSENDSVLLSIDDNKNVLAPDDADYDANEIGSFTNGFSGWSVITPDELGTNIPNYGSINYTTGIFDSDPTADGEDASNMGLSNAAYSPNGTGDKIALITTYDENDTSAGTLMNGAFGFASPYFTVERYRNYRVSVWVKTEGNNPASVAISGYDYRGTNVGTGILSGYPQLRVSSGATSGDMSDTGTHFGWKEVSFYIEGSAFYDYDVRVEIWLGNTSESDGEMTVESAQGVAMFDNVRIEEITGTELSDYSGNGSSVSFDAGTTANSISNGYFTSIEDYDEYNEPFTPTNWSVVTPEGGSSVVNDDYTDYVVGGIVSSRSTEYTYKTPSGHYLSGNIDTGKLAGEDASNLLMLKCDETTGFSSSNGLNGVAVGYKSASFSISSQTVQTVEVKMNVQNVSGYGASLVLRSGTKIIASIEQIKDTNGYKTFTFYVATGTSGLSELYLEIWLGMDDGNTQTSKLSTGTIFVESAVLTDISASESTDTEDDSAAQQALESARRTYNDMAARYQSLMDSFAAGSGVAPDIACYESYNEDFSAFDRYSNETVKTAYNFEVKSVSSASETSTDAVTYGIIDSKGTVPEGYKHANATNRYSLLIRNDAPAASRISHSVSYTLSSGSYYRIDVMMKVDIPQSQSAERPDYMGAYIGISDTEYYASDIKTTTSSDDFYHDEGDPDDYRMVTFFIHTSGTAATEGDDTSSTDTSDTIVSLEFGIGGTDSRDNWAIGSLYVNSITVSQSDASTFAEAQSNTENGGALYGKYNIIADYSDSGDDEEDDDDTDTTVNNGDNWYIYTTVVLAVAIVIALIAVLVRHYGIKRKRAGAENAENGPTYDRERTLVKQHNMRAEEEESVSSKHDAYDMFDEDEEDRLEEAELRRLEAEEQLEEGVSEEGAEESPAPAEEPAAEDEAPTEAPVSEETAEAAENATEESAPVAESAEAAPAAEEGSPAASVQPEEEEEYKYSEEIVDFTPSEEKKKELEAKRAEAERIKAEKEAAKRKADEERAKAEAEDREAHRRYNKWDDFDD